MGKRTIQEIREIAEQERIVVCDFCEDEESDIDSFNEVAFNPVPRNGMLRGKVSKDGEAVWTNGFDTDGMFSIKSDDERHLDDSCYAAFKEGL